MKLRIDPLWFSSPTGQLVMVGLLAVVAVGSVAWHRTRQKPAPAVGALKPAALPRTYSREGTRFIPVPPAAPVATALTHPAALTTPPRPQPVLPPLTLYAAVGGATDPVKPAAPYGRMIPCETVVTLESTGLETPVVGLVTADVWQDGELLIPAGAEVHGRATLDRARARLAAQGSWIISWRKPQPGEMRVNAVALEREPDAILDGTAGLRGDVLRSDDARALKLFTATFLTAATAALQEQRTGTGLLGETVLPAITARNATLAGTGAILRDYAQQLREAMARDGFYLRVPAGKPFTLYVTPPLAASSPHEN